mgnify:CR=1 FL=1
MQLLFRMGFAVGYTDHSMSLASKIRIAILHILKQEDEVEVPALDPPEKIGEGLTS